LFTGKKLRKSGGKKKPCERKIRKKIKRKKEQTAWVSLGQLEKTVGEGDCPLNREGVAEKSSGREKNERQTKYGE